MQPGAHVPALQCPPTDAQSASVVHDPVAVVHAPLTHVLGAAQSVFDVHDAGGTHLPSEHVFGDAQLAAEHVAAAALPRRAITATITTATTMPTAAIIPAAPIAYTSE
jgi:hypothetical protein